MELLNTFRDVVISEGAQAGRPIQDISEETGLPVLEVLQREIDLRLIPAKEVAWRLRPRRR